MLNLQVVNPNRPDVQVIDGKVIFPAHEAKINGQTFFFQERKMGCAPPSETLAHTAFRAAYGHLQNQRR
jgi:hypothetical protein